MTEKEREKFENEINKSPNNLALRLNYALRLFKNRMFDQSEIHYREALKLDPDNIKAKQGMSEIFFQRENYSAVIVIAEELNNKKLANEKILELLAKSYLRYNQIAEAQEIYKKLLDNNLFYFDEELDSVLEDQFEYIDSDEDIEDDDDFDGGQFPGEFNPAQIEMEIELMKEALFIDFVDYSSNYLIGMQAQQYALQYKLSAIDMESDFLANHQPENQRRRVLIYGPPGSGKSSLVKTIPNDYGLRLLPFQMTFPFAPSDADEIAFVHLYSQLANDNPESILLFDHFDTLGTERSKANNPQLTSELLSSFHPLNDSLDEVLIIALSNRPWEIDPAFFEFGKLETCILTTPPTADERKRYFKTFLDEAPLKFNMNTLVEATHMFTISEIDMMIENSFIQKYAKGYVRGNIQEKTLLEQAEMISPITPRWISKMVQESSEDIKHTYMYKQAIRYAETNNIDIS